MGEDKRRVNYMNAEDVVFISGLEDTEIDMVELAEDSESQIPTDSDQDGEGLSQNP